jgi:hypothetical protein
MMECFLFVLQKWLKTFHKGFDEEDNMEVLATIAIVMGWLLAIP